MNYLLIELYKGKSSYINEASLKEWVGKAKGKIGPNGVRTWILEEHVIVKCPDPTVQTPEPWDDQQGETFTEDEINDAHGWR
jgi:hypothetical protein